jgi:futalosine hydrolase
VYFPSNDSTSRSTSVSAAASSRRSFLAPSCTWCPIVWQELGAEDNDTFLTIQDMNLAGDDEFPFTGGRLVNASPPVLGVLASLRAVNGITVNTVHGNDDSIARVTKRFSPDVESMEGAAFMYACLIQGVPFAQVRTVSNMVERRNRAAWKLTEAIANLGTVTRQILEP